MIYGSVCSGLEAVGALAAEPGAQQQNYIAYQSGGGVVRESGDVTGTLDSARESRGSNQQRFLSNGSAVRRLTPMECERLQGFPDDYTKVPTFIVRHRKACPTLPKFVEPFLVDDTEDREYELKEAQARLEEAIKAARFEVVAPTDEKLAGCGCKVRRAAAEDCADGPRYKALGNSMAVPCMAWLGQRIEMVDALVRGLKK